MGSHAMTFIQYRGMCIVKRNFLCKHSEMSLDLTYIIQ